MYLIPRGIRAISLQSLPSSDCRKAYQRNFRIPEGCQPRLQLRKSENPNTPSLTLRAINPYPTNSRIGVPLLSTLIGRWASFSYSTF
jgi:hypothetical protein